MSSRAELGDKEPTTGPGDGLAAGLRPSERAAPFARRILTSPGLRYVIRRTLLSVPVVLGVIVVTFLLLRLIPGDPARTLLGLHAPPAAVAALRRQLGLDEPIWRQFWKYLYGLAHGNLGTSIEYQGPVASLIPPVSS